MSRLTPSSCRAHYAPNKSSQSIHCQPSSHSLAMRTPNADRLNAAMRTSTRKRKFTTTVVLSDSDDDDADYEAIVVVDSPDEYDGEMEDESEDDLSVKGRPRRRSIGPKPKAGTKRVKQSPTNQNPLNIGDVLSDWRPHTKAYHDADRIIALEDELLQWFEQVRYVRPHVLLSRALRQPFRILQRETSYAVAQAVQR